MNADRWQGEQAYRTDRQLRDYLRVLGHRWRLIVIPSLLAAVLAGAAAWYLPPPQGTYSSTAVVNPSRGTDTNRTTGAVESELMASSRIVGRVADEHGVNAETLLDQRLRTRQVSDNALIEVSVSDADPDRAAVLAQAIAESYVDVRRADLAEEQQKQIERYDEQIEELSDELARTLDGAEGENPDPSVTARATVVQSQLSKVRIDRSAEEIRTYFPGEVISDAQPPRVSTPDPLLVNGAAALGIGALVALMMCGLAFVAEAVDRRVRSVRDVELVSGDRGVGPLPVVGSGEHAPGVAVAAVRAAVAFRAALPPDGDHLIALLPVGDEDVALVAEQLSVALEGVGMRATLLGDGRELRGPGETAATDGSSGDELAGEVVIAVGSTPLESPASVQLARRAGAVGLVVQLRHSRRDDLDASIDLLAHAGVREVSVIMQERRGRLRGSARSKGRKGHRSQPSQV